MVKPKILLLAGAIASQTLLRKKLGIKRLCGNWHDYFPHADTSQQPIPTRAIYHPAFLLRQASEKKRIWLDMLAVQTRAHDLGLLGSKKELS